MEEVKFRNTKTDRSVVLSINSTEGDRIITMLKTAVISLQVRADENDRLFDTFFDFVKEDTENGIVYLKTKKDIEGRIISGSNFG